MNKLLSDEPSDRRPAIDGLGDSLCRLGVVRLLLAACLQDGGESVLGECELKVVLAAVEEYFGLGANRLRARSAAAPSPTNDSSTAILESVGVLLLPEYGLDGLGSVEVAAADGVTISWRMRPEEGLFFAGGVLARWTSKVVRTATVVGGLPGGLTSCCLSPLDSGKPGQLEEFGSSGAEC